MALESLVDVVNITDAAVTLTESVIGIFLTEPLIYFVGLSFFGATVGVVRRLMKRR